MQLKLLWELQELDLSIRDLEQKIEEAPQMSGVEEAKEHMESMEQKYAAIEERLQEDRKKLRQLELEEQKLTDDSKELNDSMYGGKVKNVKELEQMQRKLDLLAEDKKKVEEDILALMESIEEQEQKLQEAEEELNNSRQVLKDKENQLAADLQSLKRELSRLQDEREQQEAKIDRKYLDKYAVLAEKYQGKAMARVDHDICGGCRVFISSAQRGHLYNPSAMVYCENCGRLLVKLENQ